jgi:hypothetical protein
VTTIITNGVVPMLVLVRACWLLPVWFIGQILGGCDVLSNAASASHIAYLVHISGFLGGLSAAAIWKHIRPMRNIAYGTNQSKCAYGNQSRLEQHATCPAKESEIRRLDLDSNGLAKSSSTNQGHERAA